MARLVEDVIICRPNCDPAIYYVVFRTLAYSSYHHSLSLLETIAHEYQLHLTVMLVSIYCLIPLQVLHSYQVVAIIAR